MEYASALPECRPDSLSLCPDVALEKGFVQLGLAQITRPHPVTSFTGGGPVAARSDRGLRLPACYGRCARRPALLSRTNDIASPSHEKTLSRGRKGRFWHLYDQNGIWRTDRSDPNGLGVQGRQEPAAAARRGSHPNSGVWTPRRLSRLISCRCRFPRCACPRNAGD